MILSNSSIQKALANKTISITPYPKHSDIRPLGIRVYLDNILKIPQSSKTPVDIRKPLTVEYTSHDLHTQGDYILKPQGFILASITYSIKHSNQYTIMLDGRSTLARLGLQIHQTAFLCDGHFDSEMSITLELYNASNSPIILYNSMPVGSLIFIKLDGEIYGSSNKQYKGQKGVTIPNLTDSVT